MIRSPRFGLWVFTIVWLIAGQAMADDPTSVSYTKDVRPVLAVHCFGCHQGALSEADFVMTEFDKLLAGGASGDPAIVPGSPDDSLLVELITPEDGKANMPPSGKPLSDQQIEAIRCWIEQGAKNDYAKTTVVYDQKNPPVYSRLPIITSLDHSPDGKLLAVTGFHEVLLLDVSDAHSQTENNEVEPGKIVKRLIGMSSRVESVKFSPDGKRLAVSGGSPGELGEVQIWDVATGELLLSKTISHDTIYGVNWSPDGNLISFGCTDTNLRAIDSKTGDQTFFQSAHEDWIRDTVFSVDGSQLVSVGRDMTCKLNEVSTQRFIDNITSITPGVLKGGIASVARHPLRDEIVIGGSDGVPKVYRMNRITKRVIGDDANLVRLLPEMPGRIQSVDVSADGKRIAVASSLDGHGAVQIYSYEFDPTVSEQLKKILQKLPGSWSDKEREQVDAYNSADVKIIARAAVESGGLYAVDFHPAGTSFAAAGTDGKIRIFETKTGTAVSVIEPVSINETEATATSIAGWRFENLEPATKPELPTFNVAALRVSPEKIEFRWPTDYVQLVVQAILDDGSVVDVTHHATLEAEADMVQLDGPFVQAVANGSTELIIGYQDASYRIPVKVELQEPLRPNFIRDVNPVLTRLGCNAGTCHGSATGKMGFKLSLRGYDPIFDVRSFTDDMGSRRTNLASPAESLMLLKSTASVPHQGGQPVQKDTRYYRLLRDWIRDGAKLDVETPKVTAVDVFPKNSILIDADWQQQMRVVAMYADGSTRDVTREAVLEVGNIEIASVNGAIVTALRRGETSVLARYEGAFTATTFTVMGDRKGFVWTRPEAWSEIDERVADKWERMKIQPAGLCTDAEFIRRAHLDLTGLPPSVADVNSFLDDRRPTRAKRDELIDRLVGSESYVEHWSNKWADLLQVNRKYLGTEGAQAFRNWINEQVKTNRPYDEFVYEILTASGSNRINPPASYYKIHRTPQDTMENTTHLFLATRFNCNKCHDHPFERWTQDQYYETAAYFARVKLDPDPASGDKKIGGTAVEGAKPLYEIVTDADSGEVKHDRTGDIAQPELPFECDYEVADDASRRATLAAWITSPGNPYFATSYVNRLWGYLLGAGLIEPLDDIRAGNPPTNPELLELLRDEFIECDFDMQHMIRLICKSRTYQLSIKTNPFNEDDSINYSHGLARRLPAEVLFDSIHFVTGSQLMIPGVDPGTRAAALPDSGVKLPSGFLSTLGRPDRESACECERASELQLGSVLALVSGPDLSRAIGDTENELVNLIKTENDDRHVVNQLYLRILNRQATDEEIRLSLESFAKIANDHEQLVTEFNQRKTWFEERLPEFERTRTEAILQTEKNLADAIERLDPELAEKEAKRSAVIAAAEAALDNYQNKSGGFEAWLASQQSLAWYPILPTKLQSQNDQVMDNRSDRSILVTPKPGKDIYTIQSATDLTGISAVRLELLPDDSLPANGPGLADNGNLVLTEFQIEVAHPDDPETWKPVEIESALVNFEQPSYPVKNSIDGKIDDNNGWAVMGYIGKTNWATFKLKMPVGYSGGTLIRFKLHQTYDDQHQLGCFRISLTRHHKPVGLSLSEELLAQLTRPASDRSEETNKLLLSSFEKSDLKFDSLRKALGKSQQPLEIDAEIIQLREKLERVSKPVPRDAKLVQLEKDTRMSESQLENQRLTAVQDLAWALINSPSFLFNR